MASLQIEVAQALLAFRELKELNSGLQQSTQQLLNFVTTLRQKLAV